MRPLIKLSKDWKIAILGSASITAFIIAGAMLNKEYIYSAVFFMAGLYTLHPFMQLLEYGEVRKNEVRI